jgi:hypothetical protein
MIRRLIRLATGAALGLALLFSILWWMYPRFVRFESASTILALLAAVSGIPADRWAVAAERRTNMMDALTRELTENRSFFTDASFLPENQGLGQVYPRLKLSAVETALLTGIFDGHKDAEIQTRLFDWRNAAENLNRRLDLTELRLCTISQLTPMEMRVLRGISQGEDSFLSRTLLRLEALGASLEAG